MSSLFPQRHTFSVLTFLVYHKSGDERLVFFLRFAMRLCVSGRTKLSIQYVRIIVPQNGIIQTYLFVFHPKIKGIRCSRLTKFKITAFTDPGAQPVRVHDAPRLER